MLLYLFVCVLSDDRDSGKLIKKRLENVFVKRLIYPLWIGLFVLHFVVFKAENIWFTFLLLCQKWFVDF